MRGRNRRWAPAAGVLLQALVLGSGLSLPARAYEQEIRSEAEVIAAKVAEQGKTKIAVVDFTDLQGHVTELGRFMAEELSIALADSGKGFQVVDRTHLRSILEEHKLASSGLIDPETARALGKIAGVDALITGTITPFADSIHVAIKVLDANTADIITSDTVNIPKTQGIQELLAREIEGGGGEGSGGPQRRTAGRHQKEVKAADQGQLHFELQGCRYTGKQILCSVVVTNRGTDRDLLLDRSGTRIIGNDGVEYDALDVFLGTTFLSTYRQGTLVEGIPTRAGAVFNNIQRPPTEIALLELNWKQFMVQFRGIPVDK